MIGRRDGRRLLRLVTSDQAAAIALIVPSVVAVAVFVYGFIGWSAVVSMSEWDTVRPDYTFVGLSNFRDLFENFRFQIDIRKYDAILYLAWESTRISFPIVTGSY